MTENVTTSIDTIPLTMVGPEIDPTCEIKALPEGFFQDEEFSETPEGN